MKQTYATFIFSLLLFGSNGVVATFISLSSYEIVLFRTLIGSLLLLIIFFFTRQTLTFLRSKRDSLFMVGSGIAMGASWMFLYEAYAQIGVGIASLAYYCGPIIVMALSPFLFQETLTRPKLVGFVVVLCGIFLVNGQVAFEGKSSWGLFCGGMSALMFAVMVIFNKKAKGITGLENSMLQLLISFFTVALFFLCKQGFSIQVSPSDWIPILILGLINTGIGCYLYFSSFDKLPVQTVAICGYLEPLSAVAFSVLFLHEILQPVQVLGAALILGGAIWGECNVKTILHTFGKNKVEV